jgi:hypothetical protein
VNRVTPTTMLMLRRTIGATRSDTTVVGMPTLTSQGPGEYTMLVNMRSMPSTPTSCVKGGTSVGAAGDGVV